MPETTNFEATGAAKTWKAHVKIVVDGKDVTSNFDPYLISVTVTDRDGLIDTCEIDLDDSHGVLEIPKDDASIRIELGWQSQSMLATFEGRVTDVESAFQRRAGRTLKITGSGANILGAGKSQVSQQWGEGPKADEGDKGKEVPLSQVLQEAAKAAGYDMQISSDLGGIKRDSWMQTNESFHNFADRIAREVGGTFKIQDKKASLTSKNNNFNATGKAMADINCTWGDNLIAWRIQPKVARPAFNKTAVQYFDRAKGIWKKLEKAVGGSGQGSLMKAIHTGLMPVATEDQANQQADANASNSRRGVGSGWVVINGEPAAAAGSNAIVKGARAGVDGSYRINEAEHTFYRQGGYTVRLGLEQRGVSSGGDSSQLFGGN